MSLEDTVGVINDCSRSVKVEVLALPFFLVVNSCAHNCTGCGTKRKHRLHFPQIQKCSTELQEGSVIFTTLKAFLRTEFEGHICQSLISLNSQVFVCVQRVEIQREKDSSW